VADLKLGEILSPVIKYRTTTVDPTVNDDVTANFKAGVSTWLNTVTGRAFILLDDTAAAAFWKRSTGIGADFSWAFSTTTTDADPGSGNMRFDDATQADTLNIFISYTAESGADATAIINSLQVGERLLIEEEGDVKRFHVAEVTGAIVDAAPYAKVPVTIESSGQDLRNLRICTVAIMGVGSSAALNLASLGVGSNLHNIFTKYSQTADKTIANTVVETSLIGTGSGNVTILANKLKIGDPIFLRMGGHVSDTATPSLKIRIKFGGVLIAESGTFTLGGVSQDHFSIEVDITVRTIGATGTLVCTGKFIHDDGNKEINNIVKAGTTTIDFTGDNAIEITAEWGTANSANIITSQTFTIKP